MWLARGLARDRARQRKPMRLNLKSGECFMEMENRRVVAVRGVRQCLSCGSWELCLADCPVAPWNTEP